jgi:VanZ family protein
VKSKRIIRFGLLFAWLALTIFLSEQSGSESARLSNGLTKFIIDLFGLNVSVARISGVIREMAHFAIHFVLAILAYRAFMTIAKEKLSVLISLFFCGAIAVFDEITQAHIGGRAYELFDLTLNLLGVTLGLLIGFLVSKTLQRQKPSQK